MATTTRFAAVVFALAPLAAWAVPPAQPTPETVDFLTAHAGAKATLSEDGIGAIFGVPLASRGAEATTKDFVDNFLFDPTNAGILGVATLDLAPACAVRKSTVSGVGFQARTISHYRRSRIPLAWRCPAESFSAHFANGSKGEQQMATTTRFAAVVFALAPLAAWAVPPAQPTPETVDFLTAHAGAKATLSEDGIGAIFGVPLASRGAEATTKDFVDNFLFDPTNAGILGVATLDLAYDNELVISNGKFTVFTYTQKVAEEGNLPMHGGFFRYPRRGDTRLGVR